MTRCTKLLCNCMITAAAPLRIVNAPSWGWEGEIVVRWLFCRDLRPQEMDAKMSHSVS